MSISKLQKLILPRFYLCNLKDQKVLLHSFLHVFHSSNHIHQVLFCNLGNDQSLHLHATLPVIKIKHLLNYQRINDLFFVNLGHFNAKTLGTRLIFK